VSGYATLSSGTVTITTNAVRNYAGVSTVGNQYHKIHLKLITPSSAGNLRISAITDATSFVITSSNGSDASVVYWSLGM
jgi:hypothetical protein